MEGELSRQEIQDKLDLAARKNLKERYINPTLEIKFIEMTIPDKPNTPAQKLYNKLNIDADLIFKNYILFSTFSSFIYLKTADLAAAITSLLTFSVICPRFRSSIIT